MSLEKMGEFFDRRLGDYESHQLTAIDSAREFYPFTASLLPDTPGSRVLDLGCGTGLELDEYFAKNPTAIVTGIDLAPGMLDALSQKHADKSLRLICGSYFDVPLGEAAFDAAVSVESLHHFPAEQKIPLYRKLRSALRQGGYFVLTDYFAPDDGFERERFRAFSELRREAGLPEGEFYHFDTPLTVAHELSALSAAGFSRIEKMGEWANTAVIRAFA